MTSASLLVYNGSGQCFFMGKCGDLMVHNCEVGEEQATITFQKDMLGVNIPDDVVLKDAASVEPVKSDGCSFKIRYDHNYILQKGELVILRLVPYIREDHDDIMFEGELGHHRLESKRKQALTFYYHDI